MNRNHGVSIRHYSAVDAINGESTNYTFPSPANFGFDVPPTVVSQ